MTSLEQRLEAHINEEKSDIAGVQATLIKIQTNCLPHIQARADEISKDVLVLKTDAKWHKWGILAILGTLLTSLTTRFIFN